MKRAVLAGRLTKCKESSNTTQVQKCLGCNWLAKEQHRVACRPRTTAERL